MTDTQDLIAQLRKDAHHHIDGQMAGLMDEAADALAAAQAEIEALRNLFTAADLLSKSQAVEIARLTKRLNEPVPLSEWQKMEAELTAALARLAAIEAGASPACASNSVQSDSQTLLTVTDDAQGASPAAHVPETDCGNIEAMQPNSCAYCTHPLFVGLKCKHCGRVVQPSQAPEGWQLVPVEPTEAMVEAGNKHTWPYPCVYPYKAMLSAAINAQAAQPAQVPGWLPIESAPKDMASRLYRVNGFCVQGFVDAAGILCAQNDRQAWRKMHGKPTHWMPLPAAPSTKEKTE